MYSQVSHQLDSLASEIKHYLNAYESPASTQAYSLDDPVHVHYKPSVLDIVCIGRDLVARANRFLSSLEVLANGDGRLSSADNAVLAPPSPKARPLDLSEHWNWKRIRRLIIITTRYPPCEANPEPIERTCESDTDINAHLPWLENDCGTGITSSFSAKQQKTKSIL